MSNRHLDRSFAEEISAEPGGENLYRCYSCGTCTATCLVRRVSPDFNPRRILTMAVSGMREQVLSSPVIWLCSACDVCYTRCPQGIHISELMKAIRRIAVREGYEPPGPIALVDDELCSGCGLCASVCPYGGITLVANPISGNHHMVAQVDSLVCMNCGICAAACPSEAIRIEASSREKLAVRLQADGWLMQETHPKIVVFVCNWCLHAESDVDWLGELPPNTRVISVPCTGHVDSSIVLTALSAGSDGVLVVGCQPGECHYQSGNLLARRKMLELKPLLRALGVGSERLRLAWISAVDRRKIESIVKDFSEMVENVGPNPLCGKETLT